jgi:hypothetical protein
MIMEVSMSKLGSGLIAATILLLSGLMLTSGFADVQLIPPDITVTEGDREVDLVWSDPDPELLVSVDEPALGTPEFPWHGSAIMGADGFYTGACDWIYEVSVGEFQDTIEFSWFEVSDWSTGSTVSRRIKIAELDHPYDLSDGIKVWVKSDGLFESYLEGWTGPTPEFSGIYTGGALPPPTDFTFTCLSGGQISATGGGGVEIGWADDSMGSGTFTIERADSAVEIDQGLRVAFPTGTCVEGETFTADIGIALVSGDRFSVAGNTFEGYLVIRHSVEDRPGQYKVRANLAKCENPEFFEDENGDPDPYGVRHFKDKGLEDEEPGVIPDPNLPTVLNGFPYDYAVVTYDIDQNDAQVLSAIEWQRVYPAVAPGTSADRVYVVPNPYTSRAGWEVGESKIQFVNIPVGAVIRIYDATGGYIQEVRPNLNLDGSQAGTADWNLRNGQGEDVVSGIYIYRVKSDIGEKMGRFIVVR